MSYIRDRLIEYTLTQSEVISSFTSPVALFTPPAGYEAILIGPVYFKKTYAGAAFATNTNSSRVKCGPQVTTGADLNNLMTQAGDAVTVAPISIGGNLNILGGGATPVYFETQSSNPTGGGTSTIQVRFWIRLIKT